MKKQTTKKIRKVPKDLPITMSLKLNGEVTEVGIDNVFHSLRSLKDQIDPQKIKTVTIFSFSKDDKTYRRILRVGMMKMLLANDIRKMMMAKVVNITLGLTGEHLYA